MAENFTVDPKDAQDNKVMAILAYLGILVLVPIFAAKESPFARFHAGQGLNLCITGIAISVVGIILMVILGLISAALSVIAYIVLCIASLGITALMIIGIINAAKGEAKELPIIGKYRILK